MAIREMIGLGWLAFVALVLADCGAAEPADRQLHAPQFTPAEVAALDRIFSDIKIASRAAFESGDWSIMAKLDPKDVLACWDASGEDHRFSFLSMEGIPESARYEVAGLDNYIYGGVDTSRMGGTHYMAIQYEIAYLSGCEVPVAKRWPEHHFYLKKQGETFQLVHPCPLQEHIEQKSIVRLWPMVSGAQAAEVAAGMSAAERADLRQQVRKDNFPLQAILSIQDRHHLSYDQASLALDRICRVQ